MVQDLTPAQIVTELDRYIVGQAAAKRAVAIALRNRWRRAQLPADLLQEVTPKNILMIGPTGVGKTEIARRLARLVAAPFIKVEATKYTEVGYVGRDVESMVRDLVETAVRMVKTEMTETVQSRAESAANERLLDLVCPLPERTPPAKNPLEALFGGGSRQEESPREFEERYREAEVRRRDLARRLAAGELEEMMVEVELEDQSQPMFEMLGGQNMEEVGQNLQEMLGSFLPRRKRRRKATVAQARRLLMQEEAGKLIDMDAVTAEAVHRAETMGIIFIDEIDKIAGREGTHGPDVSREGVQRDILPIVEGSTIQTKYGPVRTDHVLFIAAGAFHLSKPSDLIPELQGRLPIRVELESLTEADFVRILTEPQNALVKQYRALLATDGVTLEFTADGIAAIARMAALVNRQTQNIGARRLYTILERLLEDVAFDAPGIARGNVVVDREYVESRLASIVGDDEVSRFIL